MKISSPLGKSAGFALLTLMACLVVILIVFVSVMSWITSNGKQMRRNETYTATESAAEGCSEWVFAHMDRDYLYGTLNTSNYYENYEDLLPANSWPPPGWPVQYNYNVTVTLGPTNINLEYLNSEFTNLLGAPQTNTITVTATPTGQTYNVPATVSQTYVFAEIPAFQFAIFYNINLEIDPGDTMPISGAVFSNGGIWSGTPNVTYNSTVEAAGQVSTDANDPFVADDAKSDSGTPQANFEYKGSPPQPESNVNPLVIPIGASSNGTSDTSTNVIAIVQIPPASVCAPQQVAYEITNQVYTFNEASLIVSNWYWGSNTVAPWSNNFTVYLQDSVQSPNYVRTNADGTPMNWIELTNDYYIISNRIASSGSLWTTNWVPNFQFTNNMSGIRWTNTATGTPGPGPVGTNSVWYAGFSFLTNATFYDYRESATVRAVQIDVGKLGMWINTNTPNGGSNWNQELCEDMGHGINSMYVNNAVPFIGQKQLPAVRVMDGRLLPSSTVVNVNGEKTFTSGFSFATPQPMYVLGDYNVQTNTSGSPSSLGTNNTEYTFPSAFLADAITVLSTNWNDSKYTSGYSLDSRVPINTTINAACLEGIVPSVGKTYSGGVENFLRLLEDWGATSSGNTLTYNGSIMVMFASEYATNVQQVTGNYYNAPGRNWGFDTNFLIQADLPPLTPNFTAVIRNSWSGY